MTATVIAWDNARRVFIGEYLDAFRTHEDAEPITIHQLSPFHVAVLMPELVLAVGSQLSGFCVNEDK